MVKESTMNATLTTGEFNDFCKKVDILESKGYDMTFTVDRTKDGNFDILIKGEHDLAELDKLCDDWNLNMEFNRNYMGIIWYACP